MEVRKAVQRGDVDEAIEKVNDMNPEVRQSRRRAAAAVLRRKPHSLDDGAHSLMHTTRFADP
jgi:hypothetical protein